MMMAMTHAKTGRSKKKLESNGYLRQLDAGLLLAVCSFCFASLKGAGVTVAPGRTFILPSTTIRSPVFRPVSTSHLSPIAR